MTYVYTSLTFANLLEILRVYFKKVQMTESVICESLNGLILPHLCPDSALVLRVVNHFGTDYFFEIPKTMPVKVMFDLLIGQGFLRESVAYKLDTQKLTTDYWDSKHDAPMQEENKFTNEMSMF